MKVDRCSQIKLGMNFKQVSKIIGKSPKPMDGGNIRLGTANGKFFWTGVDPINGGSAGAHFSDNALVYFVCYPGDSNKTIQLKN